MFSCPQGYYRNWRLAVFLKLECMMWIGSYLLELGTACVGLCEGLLKCPPCWQTHWGQSGNHPQARAVAQL